MNNELKDFRFEFLTEMGIDASEINYQTELWHQSIIDSAADECLQSTYVENISTLLEKYNNQRFVMYMFFIYSYVFAMDEELFTKRLDFIEELLGKDYLEKIEDDFWNSGESKIFSGIGVLLIDEEWKKYIEKIVDDGIDA